MSKLTSQSTELDFADEPGRNLARWKAVVARAFPPLRMSLTGTKDFTGHIKAAGSTELFMSAISSSGHVIERRPELISGSDTGYLKLSFHLTGSSLMVQDGRELLLRPGDMTLYDTARPYSMVHEDDFSFLVAMFPRELIRGYVPDSESLAGVKIDGTSGVGAMVSSYLQGLASNLDALSGPSGERLSRIGLDLIGTLLAEQLSREPAQGSGTVQLRRVYRYIEDHLPEPDLAPAGIAAAHYISVRHLHGLFRTEGHTVAAWIRSRRLECCRQDLRDPKLAPLTVGEIAARWGLVDAGHFSKIFRAAYGVPPSSWRAAVLPAPARSTGA
jgi:AraC-like DNA-binding protein